MRLDQYKKEIKKTITSGRKSHKTFKWETAVLIDENFKGTFKVLDVGGGDGIYAKILEQMHCEYDITSIEVFQKSINMLQEAKLYSNIIHKNVMDVDPAYFKEFDLFILGDILEHLSVADAQKLIGIMYNTNGKIIVQVPYLYKQGAVGGNIHETHLQPDLTPEVMAERYPELKVFNRNVRTGIYIFEDEATGISRTK